MALTARAMWKGVLTVGAQRVPVKLYAALQSRRVDFRLLDLSSGAPVQQEMVDPESGEPVPREQIRKGLPVGEGELALLTPEDLAAIEPEPSRDIELSHFVPLSAIDDRWYDRAYWLGPDGDPAGYFALVQALRDSEREGVARWVMRKRQYQGSLRVRGDHLVLIRLRHAEEVVPLSALPTPTGREPDERELGLAYQLVEALAGPFDPADFPETYTDRVRALIEARAAGKVVDLPPPAPREEVALEDALARSLKALGGGGGG